MVFSLLESLLIVLVVTLAVNMAFRYLRLPVIFGYLVAGLLVGPHILGWIPDTKDIKELAEFGVVLLMFTVGLQFSLSKLRSLKYAVFVLGGLQVVLSIIITTAIGLAIHMTMLMSIVVGCVVAMSSTAIVVKQLSAQMELGTKHGRNALGILLFQDLAVIPILVSIASLSGGTTQLVVPVVLWALLKGVIAILVILGAGRWLMRPLFHAIASTRVMEMFTLTVLLISIGAAWLTYTLGLSYALGAFLAGIMLGDTEYRHQIDVEIRPFRDVLLGLFFISVGALVNITTWGQTWGWIALLLVALLLGKSLLIAVLCRLSWVDARTSLRSGVILAQGGEFGFAILTLALTNNLLPEDYGQVVLAGLLISFALAPIIIQHNEKIADWILPKKWLKESPQDQSMQSMNGKGVSDHVVICGYGRVGQNIARLLDKVNLPWVAIELDPALVKTARLAGDNVLFGSVKHVELLKAADIDRAKSVVISFEDAPTAVTVLDQIRRLRPNIPIIVRGKDDSDYEHLLKHGATQVITEIFEISLKLAHQLLQTMQVSPGKVSDILQEVRDQNYTLLNKIFPGTYDEATSRGRLHEYLTPIALPEKANVIGTHLKELALSQYGVEVVAIRRGQCSIKPTSDTVLQANDILVVYGSPDELERVEALLTSG